MKAQYTPGPWRDNDGMIQCQSKWSDAGGKHFDWRYPRVLATVTEDWDAVVNGRLIAAAPDLLEALKAAYIFISDQYSYANHPAGLAFSEEAQPMIGIIAGAIAKATGQ
jgi:hypothetical protein